VATELTSQWNDFLIRQVDPYAAGKYRLLLSWLGDLSGRSALVVGSGSGEMACLLARKGAAVTATDIDSASVGLTLRTAERFGVTLQTAVSRLEDLALEVAYDLVVATDVLEHIADDSAAAAKLVSLAKPGGRVLITVPALPALMGLHDEVLGHFRRYTRRSLAALFQTTIRVERIRYYGCLLIPVAWVVSRWLRRPYPVAAVGTAAEQNSLFGAAIRLLFGWEKYLPPPVGTSLLMLGSRPPA